MVRYHQTFDGSRDTGFDDVAGANDVVGDRLFRVLFHQRHVLVRSRMKDDMGPGTAKAGLESSGIADVGNGRPDGRAWKAFAQLTLRVENAVLAVAHDDQQCRVRDRDLPAEFGSDGPAGAGDQHPLPRQVHARVGAGGHLLAPQQVSDLHLAQPGHGELAPQQLEDTGNDAGGDAAVSARFGDSTHRPPGSLRHRDDDLGDPVALDHLAQRADRADDGNALHVLAVLRAVVIEQGHGAHPELRVAPDFPGDH